MSDKLGFTFYPKDWWTSESYFELEPIERYIYLECLFVMYSNDGFMKTQKTQMERRITLEITQEQWVKITSKFTLQDGMFTDKSVNKRLRKAIANRENGSKGGRPKKEEVTEEEKPKEPNLETQNNPPLEREIESELEKKVNTNNIDEDFSSKNTSTQKLKETFEDRKMAFRKSLIPYTITPNNPNGKYDAEMVKNFYEKWTEPNKSKTKMKFEMESTWGLSLRLSTWKRNDFGNKKQFNKTNTIEATEDMFK